MSTPVQYELDFLLGAYRPLLRVPEACVVLHDCSDRHVYDLLDEGKLTGVDLGNGTKERCVRLWKHVVLHRALTPDRPLQPVHLEEVLPIHRPTFQRRELARWFGLDEKTVAAWELPGPTTDNRSLYFREAVIGFLRAREIQP